MPKEKILLHMKKVVLAKDHPAIVDALPQFRGRRGFHWFFCSRLRRDGGSRRGFSSIRTHFSHPYFSGLIVCTRFVWSFGGRSDGGERGLRRAFVHRSAL